MGKIGSLGGAGNDWMAGGNGADVFVFKSHLNDGETDFDVVADFQSGIDRLALGGRSVVEVTQNADGIALTLDGDGDTILLLGLCDANELCLL